MQDRDASIDRTIAQLVQQYETALCTYLAGLTDCPERARELAQDVFLEAFRALQGGRRWDDARAWLFRVASNLAIKDYHRRRLLDVVPLDRCDAPARCVATFLLTRRFLSVAGAPQL